MWWRSIFIVMVLNRSRLIGRLGVLSRSRLIGRLGVTYTNNKLDNNLIYLFT
jgi:hypothetical protein